MLQEQLPLHAKLRVPYLNWIVKPLETSFNKLLLKREITTVKFYQKLTFYLIWIHMKEIKFVMLLDNKASELDNTL